MAEDTPVSWIDAGEVADLIRQLQGPAQSPGPGAWELHTLPPEAKATGPAWSLMEDDEETLPLEEEGLMEMPQEKDEAVEAVETGFEPVSEAAPAWPAAADNEGMEQALDDGATSEIERIRHQLRMLRQRAEAAGVVASPAGQPAEEPVVDDGATDAVAPVTADQMQLPPLELPDTGLGDRLHSFCLWSQEGTRSDEVVLIGEFGDVIAGASTQISLVLSELMAWQSSLRDDPALALTLSAWTERPMPDGRNITFVPVRSSYGGVTLALVGSAQMSESAAMQLGSGLLLALDPVA